MSILYSKLWEMRQRGIGYYIEKMLLTMLILNVALILLYKLGKLLWI